MVGPRLRPRFELQVPFPPREVIDRLTAQSKRADCPFEGTIAGNHMHLNIRRKDQKVWSPHLNLEVLPDATGARIKGHFGPRSDIWTLVMALYAVFGFVVLMSLMFAASQWMLGMDAWAFWITGIALFMGVVVYILALTGQAFSQDQMRTLLISVEQAVERGQESYK